MQNLKDIAISDSGLVFDPSTGYIYATNPVGVFLFSALKSGRGAEKIEALLQEEYEVDPETASRDLYEFINQLITFGLLKDA